MLPFFIFNRSGLAQDFIHDRYKKGNAVLWRYNNKLRMNYEIFLFQNLHPHVDSLQLCKNIHTSNNPNLLVISCLQKIIIKERPFYLTNPIEVIKTIK